MSNGKLEKLKIRPYARLLTMLGEQLIKNMEIALIELIKNSYDADASFVKITFQNFNDNLATTETSSIVIEDDGCGMDEELIKTHWLNPATPEKLNRKKDKNYLTPKGRILQGEKGIGRFALFKLGKTVKIISRKKIDERIGENIENIIKYDFSEFDDDFQKNNIENLYMDDLVVKFEQGIPKTIIDSTILFHNMQQIRAPHGTKIIITNLKGKWSDKLLDKVQAEISRLQPIFQKENNIEFEVYIYENNKIHLSQEKIRENFLILLSQKPVFKIIDGKYIEKSKAIRFKQNNIDVNLSLNDQDITSLQLFKKHFDANTTDLQTSCGNFHFEFYIFDFNASPESAYYLDKNDKKKIKEHRIYLYRDSIRVLPYGNVDDDWLNVDTDRGTISAGQFLSNDQVVGCVYITHKDNPTLKDKTNREGLIDNGSALGDFTFILRLILQYIRKKPYAQYLIEKEKKKEFDLFKSGRPLDLIKKGNELAKGNNQILAFLSDFEKVYKNEYNILRDRISKTENLAAVGLSIETASHDLMLFMSKVISKLDATLRNLAREGLLNKDTLNLDLTEVRGNLAIVEGLMKDIQLLFPSTKSRTKNIVVKDIIEKVMSFYAKQVDELKIDLNIICSQTPLVVKTTDAVLLQVFINLFDNAIYWLKDHTNERKITINIDGNRQRLVFSDNGHGIKDDDKNYIFEAFYSGKGEEGRGLGLYIARQLLDRYDYTITLAEFSKDKLLSGANFVLEFIKNGE